MVGKAGAGEDARNRGVPVSDRLGQAAVAYLVLGVALGPARALAFVLIVVVGVGWLRLCRRYPLVARLSMGFCLGFIRGLRG